MSLNKIKLSDSNVNYTKAINDNFSNVVEKETGKGLSTNDFTDDLKTKLDGVSEGAEVNKIEKITVDGIEATITNKTVNIEIGEKATYTIAKKDEAESGYAHTYILNKTVGSTTTQVGASINIPKDLVIKSGSVKTVTEDDKPYSGAKVGDKYVDIELNDSTASHIYIPVNELVDAYSNGNGIELSSDNKFSVKIDTANANGLEVTADGVKLNVASTSNAGAMTAQMVTDLSNAENKIETIKVNGTALSITDKAVDVSVPTAIFKSVKVGTTTIDSTTTTDTLEFEAGNNVTLTPDTTNKKVKIDVTVPEGGTTLQTKSFTSTDSGWGTIDENSNYTLTLAHGKSATPTILDIKKVSSEGGYESCMANSRVDSTNFYVTADAKFDGMIIYY